jgi:hypothetical protein
MTNATNSTARPHATGVGLSRALDGYAAWAQYYLGGSYCYDTYGYECYNVSNSTWCFDTHDPTNPMFTDTSLSNTVDRQWMWMTCNEPFGYWQDGALPGRPTIVSRLVTAEYWIRQCGLFFPPGPNGQTYGIAAGRTEAEVNEYTGGWFIGSNASATNGTKSFESTRLIYANGGFDPWREAGVSSDLRPGGPLQSTEQVPVAFVPGGFHTSDLVTENGVVNASCGAVIASIVEKLVDWVGEWPGNSTST